MFGQVINGVGAGDFKIVLTLSKVITDLFSSIVVKSLLRLFLADNLLCFHFDLIFYRYSATNDFYWEISDTSARATHRRTGPTGISIQIKQVISSSLQSESSRK